MIFVIIFNRFMVLFTIHILFKQLKDQMLRVEKHYYDYSSFTELVFRNNIIAGLVGIPTFNI